MFNGRYEVREFLAPGGFCLVFRGWDRQEGREVALKVLKNGTTADGIIEFETEGQLLAGLACASNVVKLLGAAAERDAIPVRPAAVANVVVKLPVSYIVLELADACVADLLADRHLLAWDERLTLFRYIAKGMHQMHLRGIVHRDLKSENALVFPAPGASFVAKISDLGRSRDLNQPPRFAVQDYLVGRGDWRFAPPEFLWWLGTEDAATFRQADLYLLGSILFELGTGQGVTSMALGDVRAVLAATARLDPAVRARDYKARLSEIRARYLPPFRLFADEIHPALRYEGMRLLRQLCDPDPRLRELRFRADRANGTWGLEWILRRIDILRKLAQVNQRVANRGAQRKAV